MAEDPGRIYLVHLDQGMLVREGPNGPIYARHYIGWAQSDHTLQLRLERHTNGTGSSFMAEVERRAISWRLVRMWRGDRFDERRIKNRREAPRFCPVCVEERRDGRGLLHAHVPELELP